MPGSTSRWWPIGEGGCTSAAAGRRLPSAGAPRRATGSSPTRSNRANPASAAQRWLKRSKEGKNQDAVDRVAARPLHGRGDVGPAAPAGDGHSGRPRTGSVSVWIVLLVAGALVLAACTSGSPGPSTTSPASDATATPPSPADVAKRQALAAYQAMWADMVVAARTADYKSPLLPQHAAGAALSTLVRGLYTDKRLGVVVKGHPVF